MHVHLLTPRPPSLYPPPPSPPPPQKKKKKKKQEKKKRKKTRQFIGKYKNTPPQMISLSKKITYHYPSPPPLTQTTHPHPAQFFSDLDYLPT